MISLQILILLTLSSYLNGFPRTGFNSDIQFAEVSVEFKVKQTSRFKRDADHPDEVGVFITTPNGIVPLQLRRVDKQKSEPKLFTSTDQGIIQEKIPPPNESNSLYHDADFNAALTVQWTNGHPKHIHGSFLHDEKMHMIEPVVNSSSISQSPVIHRMTTSDILMDYYRDAIVLSESEQMESVRLQEPINSQNGYTPPTNLYVEYVIVADYKNYLNWADMTDDTVPAHERDIYTKQRMVEFYQHIVDGIDVIFKTANNDRYNINVIFAGILIFNHTRTPPWTDRHAICPGCDIVDDYLVLKSFSEWAWMYLQNIVRHDHAALFTGFDLYYAAQESSKTIGLSYLSKMCGNYSVSVIEEKRNALSVHVAAHELGHNFGARHDGKAGAEGCSADDKYLMASKMSRIENPVRAGNPWTFSECSRSSIYNYVQTLTRQQQNCLLDFPKVQGIPHAQLAGQSYSADNQCRFMFGKESFVCRLHHHNGWGKICYGLACWSSEHSECHVIYPHDGTSCGNKKWCQQGFCVQDERAVSLDESCPLGDDPVYNCSRRDCSEGSHSYPLCCDYCKQYATQAPHSSPPTSIASTNTTFEDNSTPEGLTTEGSESLGGDGTPTPCPCTGQTETSTSKPGSSTQNTGYPETSHRSEQTSPSSTSDNSNTPTFQSNSAISTQTPTHSVEITSRNTAGYKSTVLRTTSRSSTYTTEKGIQSTFSTAITYTDSPSTVSNRTPPVSTTVSANTSPESASAVSTSRGITTETTVKTTLYATDATPLEIFSFDTEAKISVFLSLLMLL